MITCKDTENLPRKIKVTQRRLNLVTYNMKVKIPHSGMTGITNEKYMAVVMEGYKARFSSLYGDLH